MLRICEARSYASVMSFLLFSFLLRFLSFLSFLLRFLSFLSFLLRLRFLWLEELEDEELDDGLSGLTFPSLIAKGAAVPVPVIAARGVPPTLIWEVRLTSLLFWSRVERIWTR